MIESLKREITIRSYLKHPNIVKFYGFFDDEENIYFVLEYMIGGTLSDHIA